MSSVLNLAHLSAFMLFLAAPLSLSYLQSIRTLLYSPRVLSSVPRAADALCNIVTCGSGVCVYPTPPVPRLFKLKHLRVILDPAPPLHSILRPYWSHLQDSCVIQPALSAPTPSSLGHVTISCSNRGFLTKPATPILARPTVSFFPTQEPE